LSSTCKQLQQKSTPEDAEIVCTLDDIEAKLKDMLKNLEQFQLKNADNVFNTGRFFASFFYFPEMHFINSTKIKCLLMNLNTYIVTKPPNIAYY
jgi:hypothetical protein